MSGIRPQSGPTAHPSRGRPRFKRAGGEDIVLSLFEKRGFRKQCRSVYVSRFGSLGRLARWVVICSRRRWHPSARRPRRPLFSPESALSSLWLRPTRKKSISLAPSVHTADRGQNISLAPPIAADRRQQHIAVPGCSSPVPFSVFIGRARVTPHRASRWML
jgi:hypothetical protein